MRRAKKYSIEETVKRTTGIITFYVQLGQPPEIPSVAVDRLKNHVKTHRQLLAKATLTEGNHTTCSCRSVR